MREWFSPDDILSVGSASLPDSVRGFNKLVLRDGWRTDRKRARTAERQGGGWEYHLSLLPIDAQRRLIEAERAGDEDAVEASLSLVWQAFEALPQKAKDEAASRLAAVDLVETLSPQIGRQSAISQVSARTCTPVRTLYRWLQTAAAVARADRLAALAPQRKGGTAKADCDPRAWDYLVADYMRKSQPAFEACYGRMLDAAREHGWSPIPSAKTLKRRLDAQFPPSVQALARKGTRAASAIFPHQTRDRSIFHAMEAVNADGHRFDVFVRWQDGTIGRVMMTAFQDLHSGMIVAHRLDRSENWTAVRLCLADMIEAYGVPDHVVFDNGRHFASHWLTNGAKTRFRFKMRDDKPDGVLVALGVQVHFATPYHGQAKPIERAFRDMCEEIAKHPKCEGAYTGNSPVAKPENYGKRAIPIDDFAALVKAEIARHNARQGRRSAVCNGRSFAETFRESLEAPGTLVRRATAEQRRLFLLGAEGVTCLRPTGEIHLANNRYWAEPLADLAGRRVTVRFDPQNLHLPVAIYRQDGSFLCEADCIDKTGFFDSEAASDHSRRKRQFVKARRAVLDMEQRLTIDEAAAFLPAPPPIEPVMPKVVRMVAGAGSRPGQAEVWDSEAFGRAVRMLEGDVVPFRQKEDGGGR
ncbi:hypothetical protein C3941_09250 [Kaistia algarum]|uniref:transposase domain-containing protein n=1 Tax=Kaistia algarum TaxID=2083279 RepID=UPI000CE92C9E|nr:transposase domain-containing protein [Kaistia algarum]MCX5512245.1 Mu transposase C-terminal domain-containing protein [Kaistia algarum]PPE80339.1 hypothetical protein C3941_09250 [Kaistia algarum]